MNAAALQFDPQQHRYTLRGRVLPSVTQVLQPLRSDLQRVNAEALRAAGERGTAVHVAVELDEARDLDESSLDAHTAGCLAQWRRFKVSSRLLVIASEQRVVHEANGYAGTADIFGRINGVQVAIDIKTCAPHWTHALQLAAYVDAHRASGNSAPWMRYSLHLTPDNYTLKPYTNPNDVRAWNAALTLFNYRSVHA